MTALRRFLEHPLAPVAAAAALLTLVLGWMVVDRVALLSSGREIVLAVRPVDPRDLFKGDFARLGFDIQRLDQSLVPETRDRGTAPTGFDAASRTVYVTIEEQPDKSWKPVAVDDRLPKGLAANRVALKGVMRPPYGRTVSYGIERYFVPEGTGNRIEDLARKSKLEAIVAVDGKGRAAIKGLVVDGKRVYEEPLL
jgi:uncharacterized membrane-anchored protein